VQRGGADRGKHPTDGDRREKLHIPEFSEPAAGIPTNFGWAIGFHR
jgi:hypothetical protein